MPALRDEASLNVIIPMGGRSDAFRDAGYVFPKPLMKIAGRPMLLHLIDCLQLRMGDVLWIVVPSKLHAQYGGDFDLSSEYPQVEVRVVPFALQTRGATETLYVGLQQMSPAELGRRTICLDCDNLYFSDVLGPFRRLRRDMGACFYFTDEGTAALYSYIDTDGAGMVREIAEKNPISNRANVGAYGFSSAALLRQFIGKVLDARTKQKMHYYVSTIISAMLAAGHPFIGLAAENTVQCGTPSSLEAFIAKVAAGEALRTPKRRFCFALDNVLVTAPVTAGDFSTCKPI